MLLSAFLSALKTQNVKITLLDKEDNEIIKFYSEGYSGVESDILARTVKKFEITSNSSLTITLEDAT